MKEQKSGSGSFVFGGGSRGGDSENELMYVCEDESKKCSKATESEPDCLVHLLNFFKLMTLTFGSFGGGLKSKGGSVIQFDIGSTRSIWGAISSSRVQEQNCHTRRGQVLR